MPLPVLDGFVPLPPCASCGADACAHERVYEPPPGPPVERVAIEAVADGTTYTAALWRGVMSSHDLVLFVSCVRDKPVTRLPLPGAPRGSPVLIGGRYEGRRRVYDERAVIGLTAAEVKAHGRVYERTIREGNLRRRTAEEHAAYRAAQKAAADPPVEAPPGARNGPALPAGGDEP